MPNNEDVYFSKSAFFGPFLSLSLAFQCPDRAFIVH